MYLLCILFLCAAIYMFKYYIFLMYKFGSN